MIEIVSEHFFKLRDDLFTLFLIYLSLREPALESARSRPSTSLSSIPRFRTAKPRDNLDWEGRDPDFKPLVTFLTVDQDFLDAYRMEMVEGSHFSDGTVSSGIIVNEAFARLLGGTSALDKTVLNGTESYPVIRSSVSSRIFTTKQ